MLDVNLGDPDKSASSSADLRLICKPLTVPDNLGRTSVPTEVPEQKSAPIVGGANHG